MIDVEIFDVLESDVSPFSLRLFSSATKEAGSTFGQGRFKFVLSINNLLRSALRMEHSITPVVKTYGLPAKEEEV